MRPTAWNERTGRQDGTAAPSSYIYFRSAAKCSYQIELTGTRHDSYFPSGFWRTWVPFLGSVRFGGVLACALLSCGVATGGFATYSAAVASTVCVAERTEPVQVTDRVLCAEL